MSTCRPRHLQLPLRPRTLLIADVTRLQPFTVGGDSFRENLETLVSYNVRTDGIAVLHNILYTVIRVKLYLFYYLLYTCIISCTQYLKT